LQRQGRSFPIKHLHRSQVTTVLAQRNKLLAKLALFGSEFVAMKQATEYARGLRYTNVHLWG
jgi:hypothetical protein